MSGVGPQVYDPGVSSARIAIKTTDSIVKALVNEMRKQGVEMRPCSRMDLRTIRKVIRSTVLQKVLEMRARAGIG